MKLNVQEKETGRFLLHLFENPYSSRSVLFLPFAPGDQTSNPKYGVFALIRPGFPSVILSLKTKWPCSSMFSLKVGGLCSFFESCDSSRSGLIKGHRALAWLRWDSRCWGSTETAVPKESHVGAVVCGLSRARSQHLGWPTAMRAAILDSRPFELSSNHSPTDI